jgi:hypothetical protein
MREEPRHVRWEEILTEIEVSFTHLPLYRFIKLFCFSVTGKVQYAVSLTLMLAIERQALTSETILHNVGRKSVFENLTNRVLDHDERPAPHGRDGDE